MNIPSSRRKSEATDQNHAQCPFNKQSHKRYVQKVNLEESSSCQNAYGKNTSSGCNRRIRYGNYFYGYCFSCHEFGHRALECLIHGKINSGKFNHSMKCRRYKYNEHIGNHCHIIICYMCNGIDHKSQEC